MASTKKKILCISTSIIILLTVCIVLISLSFHRISYDEYAIVFNKWNVKASQEENGLNPGIHFLGPHQKFIKFPRYVIFNRFVGDSVLEDKQTVSFENVLTINKSQMIQIFLKKRKTWMGKFLKLKMNSELLKYFVLPKMETIFIWNYISFIK